MVLDVGELDFQHRLCFLSFGFLGLVARRGGGEDDGRCEGDGDDDRYHLIFGWRKPPCFSYGEAPVVSFQFIAQCSYLFVPAVLIFCN